MSKLLVFKSSRVIFWKQVKEIFLSHSGKIMQNCRCFLFFLVETSKDRTVIKNKNNQKKSVLQQTLDKNCLVKITFVNYLRSDFVVYILAKIMQMSVSFQTKNTKIEQNINCSDQEIFNKVQKPPPPRNHHWNI